MVTRSDAHHGDSKRLIDSLRELVHTRELLFTWMQRDFQIRYSHSLLGAAWAILEPLALMIIFSLIFTVFIPLPTQGIPYPVFAYAAILPWAFFANGLNMAIPSLVGNMDLVGKIYFPKEILPLSAILVSFVDFLIASTFFAVMLLYYHIRISAWILIAPLALCVQIILMIGIGILGSAVNIFYHDVRFVIPLILQGWMYLSPVFYPVSLVGGKLKPFYLLNPMAALIDTYRRVLLQNQPPDWLYLGTAALLSILFTLASYSYFKRVEKNFADLI